MNLRDELRTLVGRSVSGEWNEADARRLSELLRTNPDAVDEYLGYLDVHGALCWNFRDVGCKSDSTVVARTDESTTSVDSRRVSLRLTGWLIGFVTGAVVASVFALLMSWSTWSSREPEHRLAHGESDRWRSESPRSSVAALLVDAFDAEFAPGNEPDGVRFGAGEFELRRGIVHLRFTHGADFVVASPARFGIVDAEHVRLAYGRVRVVAPPTARGFSIAAGNEEYVDLGTEFGLRVDAANGTNDLFVFDGQVNVTERQSGKLLSEVFEGKSTRFVCGMRGETPELGPDDFPTPGVIGLQRWRQHVETLRQDRHLLAFFPFRRTADDELLVPEFGSPEFANGRVVGASWTSGRWLGKEALLFDADNDCVQLEIPGEHQELTLAAWLKVDRLDFELNAIVNSDGSDHGDIHFQLTRQGLPRGGVIVSEKLRETVTEQVVPLGRWTHVAIVLSAPNQTQRIYVDGEVARTRSLGANRLIRPGTCRLGNWLPAAEFANATRALRGRMDELAIWSRALSEEELKLHVHVGRIGLLGTADQN